MIPVAVGAFGTILKSIFEKHIENLGIEIRNEHVQKSALLGTARKKRKVLPY